MKLTSWFRLEILSLILLYEYLFFTAVPPLSFIEILNGSLLSISIILFVGFTLYPIIDSGEGVI